MKHVLLALLVFGIHFHSFAQKQTSLSLAYFGNFAIQPGLKAGARFDFKAWEKEKTKGEKTRKRLNNLFVSPQFAVYTRPNRNTNYLLNIDTGYGFGNTERRFYQAFAVGLGYLIQSEFLSFSVNLGSGETSNKVKDLRHLFLPTLSHEFGWHTGKNRKAVLYSKYGIGSKLSGGREPSGILFLELGGRILLGKKQD